MKNSFQKKAKWPQAFAGQCSSKKVWHLWFLLLADVQETDSQIVVREMVHICPGNYY